MHKIPFKMTLFYHAHGMNGEPSARPKSKLLLVDAVESWQAGWLLWHPLEPRDVLNGDKYVKNILKCTSMVAT
jgi:hypothetical protein